jgi:hypothetical protein
MCNKVLARDGQQSKAYDQSAVKNSRCDTNLTQLTEDKKYLISDKDS